MTGLPLPEADHPLMLDAFEWLWEGWADDRGYCLPLPPKWQIKAVAVTKAGATYDDWSYAIETAMVWRSGDVRRRPAIAVFNYALGVLYSTLTERHGLNDSPRAARLVRLDAGAGS